MTAIREYPFDLSDLKQEQGDAKPRSPESTKRKVSIQTDANKSGYENHAYEKNHKNSITEYQRKKSKNEDKPHPLEGRFKKSSTSSIHSRYRQQSTTAYIEDSWWYMCCKKFHQDDNNSIPSWEPPKWQKICPYPLCPTYRHFAQTLSLVIIVMLIWAAVWVIAGDTAAPGGQLFGLAVLTIAANFGGWLILKITTLPALIGMLLTGILMQNIGLVHFDSDFLKICALLRKFALVIILTRAGLDLDPPAMKKLIVTVIKLGLGPWVVEFAIIAILSHFFLNLPWIWALMLGSIIAAVSPAVIVPCLLRLRGKGYGVAKGIPTLVLAVSGIDDAVSVAIFGIISSLMFSSSSVTLNIIQGPGSFIVGIAFGVFWGYLCKYVPEKNDAFVVPLRVLMLLCGGLFSVLGSEHIGWDGAGPLAVVASSFVAICHWSSMGWEADDNPVATAFEIFWMVFEPILFGITGAQVKIAELDGQLVLIGGGCIIAGVVLRILATAVLGIGSNLNTKEKFFVGISWMAKATVQAALGPVALDQVRRKTDHTPEELNYAETALTICIMSIVITAPLGGIFISLTGPRLLTKTVKPAIMEGWRRSHRPSIRDISIINEEDERVGSLDPEQGVDIPDENMTSTNQNTTVINQS